MGRPGTFGTVGDSPLRITGKKKRHRSESHEAPVTHSIQVDRTGKRITDFSIPLQGATYGIADIETLAIAAEITILPPAEIPFHLITGIEPLAFEETFRQTKCHGSVVGPFPRPQVERPSPDHVGYRGEGPRVFEFDRRTYSVPCGQPQQTASIPHQCGSKGMIHRSMRYCCATKGSLPCANADACCKAS